MNQQHWQLEYNNGQCVCRLVPVKNTQPYWKVTYSMQDTREVGVALEVAVDQRDAAGVSPAKPTIGSEIQ